MGGIVDRLEPQDIPGDGFYSTSTEFHPARNEEVRGGEHRACALDALQLPTR